MAGIADAPDPSADRTDIQVLLSDGRSLLHSVRPDDTLGALVDDLRRNGHLLGVSAISVGASTSLTTSDRWRQLSMTEIGAGRGMPLHITTFRPAAIKIDKFVPQKKETVDTKTVPITAGDSVDFDAIATKLRNLSFDPVEPSALVVQVQSIYTRAGEPRRAVDSYHQQNQDYVYVDEITGEQEISHQRSHHILTIVSSGSGLVAAASPSHIPALELHLNSEVMVAGEQGRLRPAFQSDLLLPHHLVLMTGIRLSKKSGATKALMLHMRGFECLNTKSGDVYANKDAAAASVAKFKGQWTLVHILVGTSSLLPRYKIPSGRTVEAWTRSGWEVAVNGRRITGHATSQAESGSIWVTTPNVSKFDHQITRAMTL